MRGGEVAMIFQDPMTSLNPVLKIGVPARGGRAAHQNVEPAAARASGRSTLARPRGRPEPGARGRPVPARVLGRHASAGDDRHGDRQRADAPDRRRADDGARRHRSRRRSSRSCKAAQDETNAAIILITTTSALVAELADRVVGDVRGRSSRWETFDTIFAAPRHPLHVGPDAVGAADRARPRRASSRSRASRRA